MADINALIAKAICQAQIASDRGKRKSNLYLKNGCGRFSKKYGYAVKQDFIIKAINIIKTSRNNFNYYVKKEADQNGYPSIVTYFDVKIEGNRYQVSFHTPLNKASNELINLVGSGRNTRWDKEIGGSITACQVMIDHYGL